MYSVIKRNKKVVIVDENDNIVYYPPNFLKPMRSRQDLQEVADSFNAHGYNIEAIMKFETKFNPRSRTISSVG